MKYGKNHLLPKRVRVEAVDEVDRIRELRSRISELEQVLGRTHAQSMLNATYLELACDDLGQDVEAFKKKCVIKPSTAQSSRKEGLA